MPAETALPRTSILIFGRGRLIAPALLIVPPMLPLVM